MSASSSRFIETRLNIARQEPIDPDDTIHVIKLEGFEEYPVIRINDDPINVNSLPSIDIQPIRKDPRIDRIPDDPIFTREYLLKTASILEEKGYFARGDNRSPEEMDGDKIPLPKCHAPNIKPHYDIEKHREYTDCSGFVSLTDQMSVAHAFGQKYEFSHGTAGYYIYIAEMERGIWMIHPHYPKESEHSAIGPVPIISYRKCFSFGPHYDQCSSIFIKKDIPVELKKKIIEAQLLPSEKINDTISPVTKRLSYERWQKNEELKQPHPFNLKTIPRMMDTSGEKKEVKHLEDLIWQNLLGKNPEKPEKKTMTAWERSLHPTDFAKLKKEHLKEGIDIYHSLHLPNVFKEHKAPHSFFLHKKNSDTHSTAAVTLLNKLAPSAKEGLQKHSDYLLYRVQKLNQQSMLASDFMRTAAFKDELYRLQMESNLSLEQTQLLALYTSGRYAEHKTSIPISTKPNPELLKKNLQTLHTSISRDLSEHPNKSAIFQVVHAASRKSQAIIQEPHVLERQNEVFAQRIQQTCTEITTVTGFCSQVASLSGSPVAARKINAIGNGASQWLGGIAVLSIGGGPLTMLTGISSILGGTRSFFDGLCGLFGNDDDDDNGMSIVSSQISEVHHDMIKGFNEILSQQVDIARGLSKQIAIRFDHVDYNLGIIQQQINQTYQYLTAQNNRISYQIGLLSQQLSETEINILKGLQAVHTDIVRSLQIISDGIAKGFNHLDEQLCKGFNHLDQEIQTFTREMRANTAEQMLLERQYFESLSREQAHQSKELKQHSIQLDAIRQHALKVQKKQNETAREKKKSQLTKYAERVLLDDFPIHTFDNSKLKYALSKTDDGRLTGDKNSLIPAEILNELGDSHQWQEIDPFDVINLLQQSESKTVHPLVHLPTQQKNLLAMIKWFLQEKTVKPKELLELKEQVEKSRNIFRFCHELSKPDAIKRDFSEISKNVTVLGQAIEKQLTLYNKEFADICRERQQHALEQHEINRVRLKKGESKEVLECLADRIKEFEINVFDERVGSNEQSLKELRLYFNRRLQQDLSRSVLREAIEAVEASVGLLHVKFKLMFESFYLNKDQTLWNVLQSCLTADKLKQLLADYQGNGKHPFLTFKNATQWYDELANHIIDALAKRTLYVDNVTLTNALLLLDNALLEFMSKDERLAYLNQVLATLPEPAKAPLLLLRGTILATEKHDLPAALADYRRASALNPDDNQIRSKYADALFALGNMEAAIREYTEILERMDDSLVPHGSLSPQLQNNLYINKGVILLSRGDAYLSSGYPAAALNDYQIACQVLPDQPEILYKIGLSYQGLDQLDLASVYYQKVLNIEHDHYDSMIALATCLSKQKKKVEAFVWYQKLLKKNPASIEFNFQCTECSPQDDKRTAEWLLKIIKHPKASIEEILRCSELALRKGELPCAQVAYDKIKNIVSTPEQYRRCVKICLQLEDPDECRVNKEKLKKLLTSQRMFKQVTPRVISDIIIGKKYVK